MPLLRPCLDCGRPSRGARCSEHERKWDRERRPPPRERGYDTQYERDRAEAIQREPWCHWPGGCQYDDVGTPANPLTADHPDPLARGGGRRQRLIPMCKRHNSAKGSR